VITDSAAIRITHGRLATVLKVQTWSDAQIDKLQEQRTGNTAAVALIAFPVSLQLRKISLPYVVNIRSVNGSGLFTQFPEHGLVGQCPEIDSIFG
jgi:hypothetical protein